jgi:hypothetical protein
MNAALCPVPSLTAFRLPGSLRLTQAFDGRRSSARPACYVVGRRRPHSRETRSESTEARIRLTGSGFDSGENVSLSTGIGFDSSESVSLSTGDRPAVARSGALKTDLRFVSTGSVSLDGECRFSRRGEGALQTG